MKNLALMVLWLCLSTQSSAQYIPLWEAGKHWIYVRYLNEDHPNIASGHLITFDGDTVIAGVAYKNIWFHNLKGTHPCPPVQQPCFQFSLPYTTTGSGSIIGFGRDDLAARKAYLLPAQNGYCQSIEYELFDFSLQQGDTLGSCLRDAVGGTQVPGFGLVDSVRTHFIYGKNRQGLQTTGWRTYVGLPYPDRLGIYEGLGFEYFGLFHHNQSLDVLYDFCEGSCAIFSGVDEPGTEHKVTFYPNPAGSSVYIQADSEIQQVWATDQLGRKIVLEMHNNQLDVSGLETGIYTIFVFFPDRNFAVKRLVILAQN